MTNELKPKITMKLSIISIGLMILILLGLTGFILSLDELGFESVLSLLVSVVMSFPIIQLILKNDVVNISDGYLVISSWGPLKVKYKLEDIVDFEVIKYKRYSDFYILVKTRKNKITRPKISGSAYNGDFDRLKEYLKNEMDNYNPELVDNVSLLKKDEQSRSRSLKIMLMFNNIIFSIFIVLMAVYNLVEFGLSDYVIIAILILMPISYGVYSITKSIDKNLATRVQAVFTFIYVIFIVIKMISIFN